MDLHVLPKQTAKVLEDSPVVAAHVPSVGFRVGDLDVEEDQVEVRQQPVREDVVVEPAAGLQGDVHVLAALAHQRRLWLHPEPVVTYIVERNINYTNSCVTYCRFCAFYRRPGHAEGYVLSHEQLASKIEEVLATQLRNGRRTKCKPCGRARQGGGRAA